MTKPWGDHKEHILLYYQAQNLPLIQVIGIMKELHGFIASQRAYRQQFSRWKVFKYSRKNPHKTLPVPRHSKTPPSSKPEVSDDQVHCGHRYPARSSPSPSVQPRRIKNHFLPYPVAKSAGFNASHTGQASALSFRTHRDDHARIMPYSDSRNTPRFVPPISESHSLHGVAVDRQSAYCTPDYEYQGTSSFGNIQQAIPHTEAFQDLTAKPQQRLWGASDMSTGAVPSMLGTTSATESRYPLTPPLPSAWAVSAKQPGGARNDLSSPTKCLDLTASKATPPSPSSLPDTNYPPAPQRSHQPMLTGLDYHSRSNNAVFGSSHASSFLSSATSAALHQHQATYPSYLA